MANENQIYGVLNELKAGITDAMDVCKSIERGNAGGFVLTPEQIAERKAGLRLAYVALTKVAAEKLQPLLKAW